MKRIVKSLVTKLWIHTDLLRVRQDFGDVHWYSHLIDPQVRVGRDNRSAWKIHSLSRQVTTESPWNTARQAQWDKSAINRMKPTASWVMCGFAVSSWSYPVFPWVSAQSRGSISLVPCWAGFLTARCWCREHTEAVESPSPPWSSESSLLTYDAVERQTCRETFFCFTDTAKHSADDFKVTRVESLRTFLMTSLRKMISVSFMVKSSSLVPDLRSLTTEGRMQRGGTRRRVRMRSAGWLDSGFIRRRGMSSFGILRKRFIATRGLRFSWTKILFHQIKKEKKDISLNQEL